MALLESKEKTVSNYIFPFGKGLPVPPLDKALLGGKGKGLAEMASLDLPVPPGFIISTAACNEYRRLHRHFPKSLEEAVPNAINQLEQQTEKLFGDPVNPLLISVRSGARSSMPGMMDTILNLGLNDETVKGFAKATRNERLAFDSYRRFIMMFSNIVEGVDRNLFNHVFEEFKRKEKVELDIELSLKSLKEVCTLFKQIYEKETKKQFPHDVYDQLFAAIRAVFNSWDGERARLYRKLNHIPEDWGTAVNVQVMVFGNKNDRSATGVGFSRDPATGAKQFYGEFLLNAQGEEVVAGIRTPQPINKTQKKNLGSTLLSLEELMPEVYNDLYGIVLKLEHHYKDMQDIEFTIDDGKLFMLQTRTGKRTGLAAIRMAVEMLHEGLIDQQTAVQRVEPEQIMQLLAPVFDEQAKKEAAAYHAAKGLNAGPGAASGKLALSKEKALEMKEKSIPCILVRRETNPDDFPGMVAAEGILTLHGGRTSHAAVVARGMGKPCVVGCGSLQINDQNKIVTAKNGLTIKEGDDLSIDGSTGDVFFCGLQASDSEIIQVLIDKTKEAHDSAVYGYYKTLMDLADKYRTMGVRANADTPQDSSTAIAFGAEGIGLCRTEHMFFEVGRLNDVRRLFFSLDKEERRKAINRLLPHQKQDFIDIFHVMDGYPVTIRLLDPPLHEFMPHTENELETLAKIMKMPLEQLEHIGHSLKEQNPMLGHRGCRLGITYPELTEMQARAIFEAAIVCSYDGIKVFVEIMVPLIGIKSELLHQKILIDQTAEKVFKAEGRQIPYTVGTMIELPRAALIADQIAELAAFFSFGTNDLTQTTFGISRDDGGKFVPLYVAGIPDPSEPEEMMQILKDDPFQILDREGVGELMRIAVEKGRSTNPQLKCGICGEHGGEPNSVRLCQELQLNYVSCSPYRVPVARLAAAQAAIIKNCKI